MINELELEFNSKLSELKREFNDRISALKLEFAERLKNPEKKHVVEPVKTNKFYYTLVDSTAVDSLKLNYSQSSRHYHYSFNTLVQNYLESYPNKRKSSVRWFKQILIYYPNDVNRFLESFESKLIEDYRDILVSMGYEIKKEVEDIPESIGFEEIEGKIILFKNSKRYGRMRRWILKAEKLYPEKKDYILTKYCTKN